MSTNRPSGELTSAADGAPVADVPDRFENPGLPPHPERMSDRDPKAAKRAERQVVALLLVSVLASLGGIVGFFLIPVGTTLVDVRLSTLVLGVGLGLGMLGIGLGAVHWSKALMSNEEYVEKRKPAYSSPEVREEAVTMLETGVDESNIARRPVLKGALVGAAALAPLPFVVPLVGELSETWDTRRFRHTAWGDVPEGTGGRLPDGTMGRRLAVDPDNRLIRAADVTNGSAFQVIPHGLPDEEHYLEEKAKAVVFMTRIDPSQLNISPERRDWSYDGIIAFSKVCTHVGCPVALYEQQTHHLLCPCHQSTFDLANEAKVVFGPANRALPQLPITVDTEGYLVARSDFHETVGPSFWERERLDENR
ncbi:Rieske (2Fe-2S) protein [Georgenia sp. H159]|uniref:cytochrome bc1 complex Rieske iron-sulfur subunit n=1 Tax=Georgenia sp. H159 TaxID=3076115 RepID=UPI002D786114|nr:Rieske (2Fe-2S) protein [Georgenia sp. H159]